jgi:hypothetical protein
MGEVYMAQRESNTFGFASSAVEDVRRLAEYGEMDAAGTPFVFSATADTIANGVKRLRAKDHDPALVKLEKFFASEVPALGVAEATGGRLGLPAPLAEERKRKNQKWLSGGKGLDMGFGAQPGSGLY